MEGATGIAGVVSNIGSVLTSVIGFFGEIFTMVTGNPLILAAVLMPVAIAFVPKGISLLKSALGRRRI